MAKRQKSDPKARKVLLRLDVQLLMKVDAAAARCQVSRERFIRQTLAAAVKGRDRRRTIGVWWRRAVSHAD